MDGIVEKIDKMRMERGWTVNKLASEAMLTQSTVANMFNTGAEPRISTLRAICEAFGITLSEFFFEENKENIDPLTMETAIALSKLDENEKRLINELTRTLLKNKNR